MITFTRIIPLSRYFSTSLINNTSGLNLDATNSLIDLLTLSNETQSLKLTQQVHAQAHRMGHTQHSLIAQKLISAYCMFKEPIQSRLVFDSFLVKNSHVCNTLLNGYGKNDLFLESFELFRDMRGSDISSLVDEFTFSVLFKIVGDFGEVFYAKMVHGMGLKAGFLLDTIVANSMMSMYGKCRCFGDSLKVFNEMPLKSVSSWNAVISGYVKVNLEEGTSHFIHDTLWEFVREMQNEGFKFDAFTLSILLPLCGIEAIKSDKNSNKRDHGREFHCYIVKNGLDLNSGSDGDVHLGCCLIDLYSKNGKVGIGRRVFDGLRYRNVFAWTAMINGYVHCGDFDKALFHFRDMQLRDGMAPNKVSLVTILPACSSIAGLMGVKQIHGFAVRRELNHEMALCNALIDMYSKGGSLSYAARVFEYECINKDAISWTSMIFGYGLHGQGQEAVTMFDKMLHNRIKPDATVAIGVLSACSRSGLLADGIRIYDSVVSNYDLVPTQEMCACMVDMLGRSGQLDRAMDFIKKMQVEPSPGIWGSVGCAAALHGDSEMANLAYESLIKLEPENSSNYISLSNLYATSKRWDVVAQVRTTMREKGLKKFPGCSWISINGATHSFFVADKSHPCSDLLYTMLDELVPAMKRSYYNSDFVHLMEVFD